MAQILSLDMDTMPDSQDVLVMTMARGRFWRRYLDQGVMWHSRDEGVVAVADMSPRWRRNAARWLVTHAQWIEFAYTLAELRDFPRPRGEMASDDYDWEVDRRGRWPGDWIQTTALYKSLTYPQEMQEPRQQRSPLIVACRRCESKVGVPCQRFNRVLKHHHKERVHDYSDLMKDQGGGTW